MFYNFQKADSEPKCTICAEIQIPRDLTSRRNPAIAHFKGLIKLILYIKVSTIANIEITMKTLLGTKICMLYRWNYVKSGCAIAGLHCMSSYSK